MRRVFRADKTLPAAPILICDEPAEGSEMSLGTLVSGWAYSPAGIREVSVWLDGRQMVGEAEYGLLREDVAQASPEWPNALRSGFSYRSETLPASAETAELMVVAEDGEGRRSEVRRIVRPVDHVVVCDEPEEGSEVTLGTVVEGWAYGPAGIREVSIWLDGQRVGEADLGLEREDVARAHPDWPGALRCGFRYRFDASLGAPPPRVAELVVVAEDSEGGRVEERRVVQVVEPPPPPMAGSLDIPKVRPPQDPLGGTGWSSPLVVHGWAVDPEGVDQIEVLLDGRVVGQAEHGLPREDVQGLQPDYRRLGLAIRSGWLAVIPTEDFGAGEHTLSATVHGGSGTLPLGPTTVSLRAESVRTDPVRRQRMEALLHCPGCGHPLTRTEAGLVCCSCGQEIRANEFGTLLFDETYAGLDWRQAVATSHPYPPDAAQIIHDCRDGLVLEIGAGLRENLPNVIQLDAIAFPTTDVSANAEALPFADESFDGVIACALLEHVSSPHAVVREMRRVCKMGGRIYADSTTVHPYHGFPHHYFNATETGLNWLMREIGGVNGSARSWDARHTMKLVLEAWLGSLEDEGAREFVAGMSVGDFVAFLANPEVSPDRYAALDNLFPNGRRLVPYKVTFSGVRAR